MIDIHAHILPEVDDGSYNLVESLRMIKMAYASGVTAMAATPHCNIPGAFRNYASEELLSKFYELQKAVEQSDLPVQIFSGMEIFATGQMPRYLEEGKVWTLNGTKYFLTEFDFHENPEFCMMILEDCHDAGFIPVIAHPERYFFVQECPEIVYEWFCQGYGIQINKGSLLGKFGQRAQIMAELLLQHGLVSCVASDAHSARQRTPHMQEAEQYLRKNFGSDYTRLVTEVNPERILRGEKLERLEPIPF